MVQYGNLRMIKAHFNGSTAMGEKGQLYDKSGYPYSANMRSIVMPCEFRFGQIILFIRYFFVFCSNVVAATDVTLLALAGVGLRHEKVRRAHKLVNTLSSQLACSDSACSTPLEKAIWLHAAGVHSWSHTTKIICQPALE